MSEAGQGQRLFTTDAEAFPWPTVLFALAASLFFLVLTAPDLAAFYELPAVAHRPEVRYGVVAVLALLAWLDVRRHARRRARQKTELEQLRNQVDDLWARNKELQMKAHTYSEHADKLKLFISDKLLEYIEYDEKFLHFKGIAAEVRHNGVISFDKVQTALQRGLSESGADGEPGAGYQSALEALHYLWDLLDLSTAENLTLHIGNLLCEAEEQYCQRLLDSEQARALPNEPAYPPQRAAWRAVAMVRQDPLPAPDGETDYELDDGQVRAHLQPAGELLGKENHFVLLLENLLRNAQFYAAKPGYSAPFAPIAVTLTEEDGDACLRVYNRGPHVREEDLGHLFQLGYSTRRKREHHGRGLGLYFVNEIVKGYEGRIDVHNIDSQPTRYELRLTLQNGEEIVEPVETTIEDGRPRCQAANGEPTRTLEWTTRSPVLAVTVRADGEDTGTTVEGFAKRGRQEFHDPAHPTRPRWRVRYRPKPLANRLEFEPLDVRGVEFEVRLPTARKRVDTAGAALEVGF
ncbi:sensor histidine kinase [Ectothiorhodospiraceae bacterium WFHF3C12]|nr:sensor histidine kinase [Ectothiorhodospiraceae bacterium WFHF3C12]